MYPQHMFSWKNKKKIFIWIYILLSVALTDEQIDTVFDLIELTGNTHSW